MFVPFERRDGFSQQQIISAMMGNVPVNFELNARNAVRKTK